MVEQLPRYGSCDWSLINHNLNLLFSKPFPFCLCMSFLFILNSKIPDSLNTSWTEEIRIEGQSLSSPTRFNALPR